MIRRTKAEMYLSILEALADGPLIVTHLTNKTNIGHGPLKPFCKHLIDHGLIEKNEPPPSRRNKRRDRRIKYLYHITETGREMLERDVKLCWVLGLGSNLTGSEVKRDIGCNNKNNHIRRRSMVNE